jgi:hypothetical protein
MARLACSDCTPVYAAIFMYPVRHCQTIDGNI